MKYIKTLSQNGFLISIYRKENPDDNAIAESFFKTLKVQEVYLWKCRILEDAQIRLPFFIHEGYNFRRLHYYFSYRSAFEFEELFLPCPVAVIQSV